MVAILRGAWSIGVPFDAFVLGALDPNE